MTSRFKPIFFVISTFALVMSFQNCAKNSFNAVDLQVSGDGVSLSIDTAKADHDPLLEDSALDSEAPISTTPPLEDTTWITGPQYVLEQIMGDGADLKVFNAPFTLQFSALYSVNPEVPIQGMSVGESQKTLPPNVVSNKSLHFSAAVPCGLLYSGTGTISRYNGYALRAGELQLQIESKAASTADGNCPFRFGSADTELSSGDAYPDLLSSVRSYHIAGERLFLHLKSADNKVAVYRKRRKEVVPSDIARRLSVGVWRWHSIQEVDLCLLRAAKDPAVNCPMRIIPIEPVGRGHSLTFAYKAGETLNDFSGISGCTRFKGVYALTPQTDGKTVHLSMSITNTGEDAAATTCSSNVKDEQESKRFLALLGSGEVMNVRLNGNVLGLTATVSNQILTFMQEQAICGVNGVTEDCIHIPPPRPPCDSNLNNGVGCLPEQQPICGVNGVYENCITIPPVEPPRPTPKPPCTPGGITGSLNCLPPIEDPRPLPQPHNREL